MLGSQARLRDLGKLYPYNKMLPVVFTGQENVEAMQMWVLLPHAFTFAAVRLRTSSLHVVGCSGMLAVAFMNQKQVICLEKRHQEAAMC